MSNTPLSNLQDNKTFLLFIYFLIIFAHIFFLFSDFVAFLDFLKYICKADRNSSYLLVHYTNTQQQPGLSQQLRTQSGSPKWVAGTQPLESLPAAFVAK